MSYRSINDELNKKIPLGVRRTMSVCIMGPIVLALYVAFVIAVLSMFLVLPFGFILAPLWVLGAIGFLVLLVIRWLTMLAKRPTSKPAATNDEMPTSIFGN